jgi:hypothetical protein
MVCASGKKCDISRAQLGGVGEEGAICVRSSSFLDIIFFFETATKRHAESKQKLMKLYATTTNQLTV